MVSSSVPERDKVCKFDKFRILLGITFKGKSEMYKCSIFEKFGKDVKLILSKIYIKYSMGRTRSYTIYEKSDLDKSNVRKYYITNNKK